MYGREQLKPKTVHTHKNSCVSVIWCSYGDLLCICHCIVGGVVFQKFPPGYILTQQLLVSFDSE